MYPAEPDDPEEARRLRKTAETAARLKLDALVAAAAPGSFEYEFLRRDPATFEDFHFDLLTRLAWHYRRRIPRFLAPALNPDDPIVRHKNG
jgi:hypothetical protein